MLSISEAAELLGVNLQTLRRWDKSGKLRADFVSPGGHRRYHQWTIDIFSKDLAKIAQDWATSAQSEPPPMAQYCPNSGTFQTRLNRFQTALQQTPGISQDFPLWVAIAGEIGNNSFDHNLGNWPDVPGIFFAFDLNKKYIVLADRGQGILATLKRVRQNLTNDSEALQTAFTEVVTGRAPENRGNGLKFVRSVVNHNPIKLSFQSGNAIVHLAQGNRSLEILTSSHPINGTFVYIQY